MLRKTTKFLSFFVAVVLIASIMTGFASANAKLDANKELAVKLSDKYSGLIQEVGQTVWDFAEVGKFEYKSSNFLVDKLEELGFEVERGVGGFPTGFIGQYTYGTGGPVIGLLCEYDALPGLSSEVSGESGHGCGHNLYAAGAIGSAAVLKELMETKKIPGTIKVFGTPSEEIYASKMFYAKQGLLDGVDVFIGYHASSNNGVPFTENSALSYKRYAFHGVASHAGSSPEKGISALDAQELMNIAVNFLREHVPQDVRLHYIISKGGDAANIVPAYAESYYYIRALSIETVAQVEKRVDDIAKAAAMATGCTAEIEFIDSCANKILNRAGAELAYKNTVLVGPPTFDQKDQTAAKALGYEKGLSTVIEPLPDVPHKSGGSSDEGDVSWHAPLINFSMANYASGTPGHSLDLTKQVNMPAAYKATTQTVKAVACTAVDILTKPEELKKIQDEFAETMKDKEYPLGISKTPNPKEFKNAPGVVTTGSNKLTFTPNDTILLKEEAGTVVNVYLGDEKIGTTTLKDATSKYSITTTKDFKDGDILVIKYQPKDAGNETLLGYISSFQQ